LLLKLRDILQQPLLGGDVDLLENGQPALTGTADSEGRTLFSYAPFEGGDYQLTARYKGGGFFLPSKTDLDIKVFLPTTLRILEPPGGADSRQISLTPFDIQGGLTDIHDRPVARQGVTVSLDGVAGSRESATGDFGDFASNIEPRLPGEQILNISFPGAGFYRPSEDEVIVPVFMPVVMEPEVPARALVGVPAAIGASVKDLLGEPVPEGRVSVDLDSKELDSGIVDGQGFARLSVPLEQQGDTQLTLLYESEDHYLPQSISVSLPVFLTTEVTLVTPEAANVGDPLELTGTLTDTNGQPMPGRQVNLYEEDVFLTEVRTGDAGFFSAEMTPQTFGSRQISAQFAEQDFFEASSTSRNLPVFIDTVVTVTLADSADAGTPTELSIRVTDETGVIVPAGLVEVSGDGVLTGTFPVSDGAASGTVVFDQGGRIRLEASLQPTEFYLPSLVSQDVQVSMPTSIILDPLPKPGVYEPFQVSGGLVDFFDRGVPGRDMVFESPASMTIPQAATDEAGRFTAEFNIEQPGASSINIRFLRNGNFKESSSEAVLTVVPVVLSLSPPPHLTRGQDNEVSGQVFRGEDPLADETVELSLDGRSIGSGKSDDSGEFRINVAPVSLASLAPHRLTADISRVQLSESWDIPVKAATSLSITAPPTAHNGNRIELTAVLVDDQGEPLANQAVTLDGQAVGLTNELGGLVVEHTVPEGTLPKDRDEIQYQVAMGYGGTNQYLPVESPVSLVITPPPPILLITLLTAAGLAAVSGPSTAYLVARHRRRSRLRWPSEVADSYDLKQLENQTGVPFAGLASKMPTTVVVSANGLVMEEKLHVVTGDTLVLDVLVQDGEGHSIVTPIFFQQGDEPTSVTQGKEG
jgi:hypothetical protein